MSKRYYRPPNMRKEECTYVGGRSADKPASMRPRLSPGTARFPGADSGAQLNVPPQKTGASDDDPCGLLRAYTRPNSSSATDSYETSAFVSPSSHGLGGSLIYSSPEPKSDPSAAFFRSFEMAIENGAGVVRSHGSSPLASEQPQYFHQPQHAMPGIGAAFRTGGE